MSDSSTHSFNVRPIHGEIHWGGGMRPTPLSYARYVNGHERVAEHVELDGVRYVPEVGRDGLEEAYGSLQAHFDKTRERWMQRGAHIAKQQERIDELESLVRDMWPLVLLEFPHVTSVTNELLEMHEELRERMAALGLLEGDA